MAQARLALKSLHRRVFSSAPTLHLQGHLGPKRGGELVKGFSTSADQKSAEVAVSEGGKTSRLFPRRRRGRRGLSLWRDNDEPNLVPAFNELFPRGLGNALLQATENINKLIETINPTPPPLDVRVRKQDDCYKLRLDLPGLSKEEIKITVHDGLLTIKGEHKQEEEEEEEDENHWSATSYGHFSTSLALPDDALPDEATAEMRDGVLSVVIPRDDKAKRDVREVKIG